MMIRKHDTNGTKSPLTEGEFGYDKQGSDRGRVYVGTNTGNSALAKKSEVDSKVNTSLLGANNGVATLDSTGKLTATQLPTSVTGGLKYLGTFNASTGLPSIGSATQANNGHYYKVSTSGSFDINGINEWGAGDWIISNGTTWDKIDNSEIVLSVNGQVGNVVIDKNTIGLENVENILDANKVVYSASKLTNPILVNGSSWDGTTDLNISTDGFSGSYLDLTDKPTLFNGNYNSLTNKPIIPTVPTTISSFTNDSGYVTSSYHDSSKQDCLVSGTTIKTVNGTSVLGSGDIVISGGTTYTAGTGIAIAANSICVLSTCNTKWNNKQDALVSGTNIKTVNGQSITGAGDIVISGTGVTAGVLADKSITCVNLGRVNLPVGLYTYCNLSLNTSFSSVGNYTKYLPGSTCITSATMLCGYVNGASFYYCSGKIANADPGYDSKCLLTNGEYYYSVCGKEALACTTIYYLAFKVSITNSILTICMRRAVSALASIGTNYTSSDPCIFFNYAIACDQFTNASSSWDKVCGVNIGYCSTIASANPSLYLNDIGLTAEGIDNGQSLLYCSDAKAFLPYTPISSVGAGIVNNSGSVSINTLCDTKWNGKQDALVSGTNIKSINGSSILTSGNLVIPTSYTLDALSNVAVSATNTIYGVLMRDTNCSDSWVESNEIYGTSSALNISSAAKPIFMSSCAVCSTYSELECTKVGTTYGIVCKNIIIPSTNNSTSAMLCISNVVTLNNSSAGTICLFDNFCSSKYVDKYDSYNVYCENANIVRNVAVYSVCNTTGSISSGACVINSKTLNYVNNGRYSNIDTYNLCCGCYTAIVCVNANGTSCVRNIYDGATSTNLSNVKSYSSQVENGVVNRYSVLLTGNDGSAGYACCNSICFGAGAYGFVSINAGYGYANYACKLSMFGQIVDIQSALVACPGYTALRHNCLDFVCIPNTCTFKVSNLLNVSVDQSGSCGTLCVGNNVTISSSCVKVAGIHRCSADSSINISDTFVNLVSYLGGTNINSCQSNTNIKSVCDISLYAGYVFGNSTFNGGSISVSCLGGASLTSRGDGVSIISSSCCSLICSSKQILISAQDTVYGVIAIESCVCNEIISPVNKITGSICNYISGPTYISPSSVTNVMASCLATVNTNNKLYRVGNLLMIGSGTALDSCCSTITSFSNGTMLVYNSVCESFIPRNKSEVLTSLGLNDVIKNYNASDGLTEVLLTYNGVCAFATNTCNSVTPAIADSFATFGTTSVYGNAVTSIRSISGSTKSATTCITTTGTNANSKEFIDSCGFSCKNITLYSSLGCRNDFSICGLPTTVGTGANSLWIDNKGFLKIGTCTASPGLSVSVCNIVYTATANQTSFALPLDSPTMLSVHLNGLKLPATCYTNSGSSISFATGITLDDVIDIDMIKIV